MQLYAIHVCNNASNSSIVTTAYRMTLQVVPTANVSWLSIDSNATRSQSPASLTALVPTGAVIDFNSPAVSAAGFERRLNTPW